MNIYRWKAEANDVRILYAGDVPVGRAEGYTKKSRDGARFWRYCAVWMKVDPDGLYCSYMGNFRTLVAAQNHIEQELGITVEAPSGDGQRRAINP